MREFRTSYNAPCSADRRCKPSYVNGRVNVRVPLSSARTGEAVLRPFSDFPADRACLTRVGGVDVGHYKAKPLRLVGNKVLQLAKRPSVQAPSDALSGLDVGANVRQVFHADFPRAGSDRLCNDSLADFVVHVLHMPLLTPGESPQLTLGCTAPVGLKTATMGKVLVAVMPQFSAPEHLASAGCSEIVFPHVATHRTATRNRRHGRNVEREVEVPRALADGQLCLFGYPVREQIALVLAADERHLYAPAEGEQRKHFALDGVSALVEIDRCGSEGDDGDGLVLGDARVGLETLVRIGDPMHGLTHHLTAKGRELLSHRVVRQMVQRHTVPASMLDRDRNNRGAGCRKRLRQSSQRRRLLGGRLKLQRDGACYHIGNYTMRNSKSKQPIGCTPFLPGMNAGVSRST